MVCVYLNHSCYVQFVVLLWSVPGTAQKMKFSIKDFFSKGDHIRSLLRIWSHSLKKSFMENLIFCAVWMYFIFILKDDRLIKASQDIWLVNCHTCGQNAVIHGLWLLYSGILSKHSMIILTMHFWHSHRMFHACLLG